MQFDGTEFVYYYSFGRAIQSLTPSFDIFTSLPRYNTKSNQHGKQQET